VPESFAPSEDGAFTMGEPYGTTSFQSGQCIAVQGPERLAGRLAPSVLPEELSRDACAAVLRDQHIERDVSVV